MTRWTRRTGTPPSAELANLRGRLAASAARYPRHPDVIIETRRLGNVECLIAAPPRVQRRLLYFHGGGFRLGSPELVAGFASMLAATADCEVVMPFYSLAPDHPFPAALLDGRAVLASLPFDTPLLVGGDSAGGNLAAVAACHQPERLAGLLLISPWLDLRVTAASYDVNAEADGVFSRAAARQAADLYLQGHSATDPDASPLLGDLTRLPPALIAVGGGEVLLDDALTFAAGLARRQRRVELHVLPDMAHVEAVLQAGRPCSDAVLQHAARFIRAA